MPVGFGMNIKMLVEHDLIPANLWGLAALIGLLLALTALTGFTLIGSAAMVAARRVGRKAVTPITQGETEGCPR